MEAPVAGGGGEGRPVVRADVPLPGEVVAQHRLTQVVDRPAGTGTGDLIVEAERGVGRPNAVDGGVQQAGGIAGGARPDRGGGVLRHRPDQEAGQLLRIGEARELVAGEPVRQLASVRNSASSIFT